MNPIAWAALAPLIDWSLVVLQWAPVRYAVLYVVVVALALAMLAINPIDD